MRASRDRASTVRRELQRVAAGELNAHHALFDAIGPDVFAVAAVVTGRPQAAGEVTVEAFREIASTADALHHSPDAVVRILSLTQRLARDRVRPRPLLV